MPGTSNILELDPDGDYNSLRSLPNDEIVKRWKDSPTRQVSEALMGLNGAMWPKEGEDAKPGFVVAGTGVEALREARAVLANGLAPSNLFPAGSELTAVFFAYCREGALQLMSVRMRGNQIVIEYRAVALLTKSLVDDLALIPLGKLRTGNYRVEMQQLPPGREQYDRSYAADATDVTPQDMQLAQRFVCHSFSFDVSDTSGQ
jgi:hypothetical protein